MINKLYAVLVLIVLSPGLLLFLVWCCTISSLVWCVERAAELDFDFAMPFRWYGRWLTKLTGMKE